MNQTRDVGLCRGLTAPTCCRQLRPHRLLRRPIPPPHRNSPVDLSHLTYLITFLDGTQHFTRTITTLMAPLNLSTPTNNCISDKFYSTIISSIFAVTTISQNTTCYPESLLLLFTYFILFIISDISYNQF